jgi:hypothetical protein
MTSLLVNKMPHSYNTREVFTVCAEISIQFRFDISRYFSILFDTLSCFSFRLIEANLSVSVKNIGKFFLLEGSPWNVGGHLPKRSTLAFRPAWHYAKKTRQVSIMMSCIFLKTNGMHKVVDDVSACSQESSKLNVHHATCITLRLKVLTDVKAIQKNEKGAI